MNLLAKFQVKGAEILISQFAIRNRIQQTLGALGFELL